MSWFRKTTASSGRGIEYRAPVDSAFSDPPRNSREIVYWMVLDGRRIQRHSNPLRALLNRRARPRVLYSALVTVPVMILAVLAMCVVLIPVGMALIGLALLAPGSIAAGILSIAALAIGMIAGLCFVVILTDKICQPYLKARGVSHDEGTVGMFLGLAPLALIALIAQVIT